MFIFPIVKSSFIRTTSSVESFPQSPIEPSFMFHKIIFVSEVILPNVTVGESYFMNSSHMFHMVIFISEVFDANITVGESCYSTFEASTFEVWIRIHIEELPYLNIIQTSQTLAKVERFVKMYCFLHTFWECVSSMAWSFCLDGL